MKRLGKLLTALLLWGCLLAACGRPAAPTPAPVQGRPNLLVIISDDQRYDTLDYMPQVRSRIFEQGVAFSRAYATTPLCCPSRASLLTGMYAHSHGVRTNLDPLDKRTVVERLHEAGYTTGLVGKYLNSWDGTRRPEFDDWIALAGHGAAQRYFDPRLNVNGQWQLERGYTPFLLRDHAADFLRQAARQDKPFLLIFAPNPPHAPADPAPGDEQLYPDLPLYRPPSFNRAAGPDKPRYLQNQTELTGDKIAQIDAARRKHLQSLNALDQSVASLLQILDEQGQAEKTAVIYLSDNAIFWGEHRLSGKMQLYEQAIHVPMAIRYAPLAPQSRLENRLVANIDIAPTLYELAGQPIPPEVEGRSLVPLLRGTNSWRRDVLIEAWSTPPGYLDEEGVFFNSRGIRTERHVYLQTEGDRDELYDLVADPFQLKNLAGNPGAAAIQRDLQARLGQVRPAPVARAWAAQCTNPTGPLDEDQILRRIKQGNLRLIYFDCGQSWIYPLGGKQPGWMIIPTDAPEWAKGKLSQSNPKAADGFWVYADDGGARWPQGGRVRVSPSDVSLSTASAAAPVDLPLSFQGGLTLLGYQLEQTHFKPGDTISIVTAWRVDQVPGQLISLMAHLMGPGEQAVATGDSLGVPIEYMERGDVFVQRHTFALPANAPAGVYWFQTGVYGFENDTRWPVSDARVKGNRVMLGPLQVKP